MLIIFSFLLLLSSIAKSMDNDASLIEQTKNEIMQEEFTEKYYSLRKKLKNEIEKIDLVNNYQDGLTTLEKYKKKNPLIALTECTIPNCSLGRADNPQRRIAFEEETSHEIAEQLNNKGTLTIVSFGSGNLLQDALVYTKALCQVKKKSELTIHNVDYNYTYNVCYSDFVGEKREVKKEDFANASALEFITNNLINKSLSFVAKMRPHKPTLSYSNNSKQQTELSKMHYISYKQNILREYLEKAFPSSKISLYIHQSAESYLQYIKREKCASPEMVMAIDIDKPEDIKSGSTLSYAAVSKKAFENQNAATFLLARPYETPNKGATLLCMKKQNGETPDAFIYSIK